jgi:hypothetical protein
MVKYVKVHVNDQAEKLEIGRFLHLKSEIRNRKLHETTQLLQSNLSFRILDLRCRNRPISAFADGASCPLVRISVPTYRGSTATNRVCPSRLTRSSTGLDRCAISSA